MTPLTDTTPGEIQKLLQRRKVLGKTAPFSSDQAELVAAYIRSLQEQNEALAKEHGKMKALLLSADCSLESVASVECFIRQVKAIQKAVSALSPIPFTPMTHSELSGQIPAYLLASTPIELQCTDCGSRGAHYCTGFEKGPWNCTCSGCPIHPQKS